MIVGQGTCNRFSSSVFVTFCPSQSLISPSPILATHSGRLTNQQPSLCNAVQ